MPPGGELCGMRLQKLPRARDVPLSCTKVADGKTQDEAVVQPRVRQKHLACGVDGFEQLRVERVQLVVAHRPGAGARAETDDAEWHRCHSLEIVIGIDPLAEELSETDVLGECAANPFRSKMTKNHPKFQ